MYKTATSVDMHVHDYIPEQIVKLHQIHMQVVHEQTLLHHFLQHQYIENEQVMNVIQQI